MGRDGASFPRWWRLRLDHVPAWDRRRRFPGVSGLRERLDILGRSRLQARLPELLKVNNRCYKQDRHALAIRIVVTPRLVSINNARVIRLVSIDIWLINIE